MLIWVPCLLSACQIYLECFPHQPVNKARFSRCSAACFFSFLPRNLLPPHVTLSHDLEHKKELPHDRSLPSDLLLSDFSTSLSSQSSIHVPGQSRPLPELPPWPSPSLNSSPSKLRKESLPASPWSAPFSSSSPSSLPPNSAAPLIALFSTPPGVTQSAISQH